MRILVDADACPVVDIAISLAKEYNKEIILYYDDAHQTTKDYATIKMVSQGPDAVDYALINDLKLGDIVISQDYGVAQMALARGAYPINQNGMIYNDNNISYLLEVRSIMAHERRSNKKTHLKGPKKRTKENDIAFYNTLKKLLEEAYD
ncbi:MAG: YaiI/YqxD family protein [Acholeplasmatales bacterium]|nr:YaiI/YqxD family protein [Acholeplasmatales bacterium]